MTKRYNCAYVDAKLTSTAHASVVATKNNVSIEFLT